MVVLQRHVHVKLYYCCIMKHFYLLLSAAFLFAACSKDKFDPSKPKDGQEVEVFLDHYTTAGDPRIFHTDRDHSLYTYLHKFDEREIGYTYVIKARVVVSPPSWQDSPSYTLDYIKTLAKEKYQGKDTFALPLFGWTGGGSDAFFLRKDAGKYSYLGFQLTPADATVQQDLDTALVKGPPMTTSAGPWTAFKVFVQHDPANYTKGYIVHRVQLP